MRTAFLAAALPLALTLAPAALAADATFNMSTEPGYISVDASVMHDVTPDIVNLGVYCELQTPNKTRTGARADLQKKINEVKEFVGTEATIRRNASFTIYNYGYSETDNLSYTGNVNFTVKKIAPALAAKMLEKVESLGCTGQWEVRLSYAGKYALEQKDELLKQIDDKRLFFESLIDQKLTRVSSLSFYTSLDASYYGGYGTSGGIYDPETNTAPATTTLNVSYITGPLPTPTK